MPLARVDEPRREPPARPVPSDAEARVVRLRSVMALVVIWVLWGLWFHLNFPGGVPAFSLISFIIGIPSAVIGLLPPAEKDGWRQKWMTRVQDALARPAVATTLAWLAGATLVLGTVVSSVRVETTRGAPAQVRIVEGSQSRPDTAAPTAMTLRVGHDRAADVALQLAWPASRWAHTQSQVSQSDQRALPWRPARWTYPDDFDESVTLFVLPMAQTNAALRSSAGAPRLVVLGATGDTIVATTVNARGLRVEFLPRSLDQDTLRASWTRAYRARLSPPWATPADSLLLVELRTTADSTLGQTLLGRREAMLEELKSVPSRVEMWMGARRERGRRPLHRGETVRFQFLDERGPITLPVEVVLDRNPYPLLIEASHVDRDQPLPPT